MNTMQQMLFSLVSGYVLADMCKLSYEDKIFVAFVSAAIPLLTWVLGEFKTNQKQD